MKKVSRLIGLVALLALNGCHLLPANPKEVVVAECYGKYLYESDLRDVIPENIPVMDSVQRANAFIENWIQRQVLLHQAEANLSKDDLDFAKQVEEYRNSLVIYSYETQLIRQKLDTVVSEAEIERYYDEHKDNFQVRNTMVKTAYVIVDENCRQKDQFAKLLRDKDTLKLRNLDLLASAHAIKSHLDVDHWMRLDELTNTVHIEITNVESFLKRNKFVSLDWNDYTCMVRFVDYLLEESVSPLDLERQNIRNIILEQRKKSLLDRMKASLYEQARNDNAFEVYAGTPRTNETNTD